MRFSTIKARERYQECLSFARKNGLLKNYLETFARLLLWENYDETTAQRISEIVIGMDWDDKCFSFSEQRSDGTYGICGGIIFHGTPGMGYLENGSCMLSPSYGWQIHT